MENASTNQAIRTTKDMKLPYPTFQEATQHQQQQQNTTPSNPTQSQLQQQYQLQMQLHQQQLAAQSAQQQQKRKRVTRACDECRKKKVKCDGQQPCIHCTVYSYDCTYDQPSNRKKNVAELHVVENKLKTAEQMLHLLFPTLDILDEDFNYDLFEDVYHKNKSSVEGLEKLALVYKQREPLEPAFTAAAASPNLTSSGSSTPAPNSGHVPIKPNVSKLASSSTANSSTDSRPLKKAKLSYPHQNIDGSIESKDGREIKIILPPKNVALELVTKMWASPCVLFRFYHRPSFIKDLDELYETDPENYTDQQNRFLPLAYSVMAVGALFSKKNGVDDKFLEDEGYRYFIAARKLIDITEARDIYAMQTILTLVLFLQCSARLSTCYSYIGIALRSALREGLHRKSNDSRRFNPLENEVRKRIFWTIYKMDIYVNGMLGLPRSIAREDIDQEMPLGLDDENITETGYLPQEVGKLSSNGISNQHTDLILVLNKIVKNLYPIASNRKFVISHEKVSEMELELRAWLSNLPKELIPGYDPAFQYYKANRLLHLSFLHVQIVLYRPFIHYISPRYADQPHVDQLSVQRAKNCISVARTCVKLAQDMINKNMLSGPYWFSIYTIFFSVACLVYYVHEVPMDEFHPDYIDIKRDAESGKKILTVLKDSSMAASKIYNILNSLFEQLNRRTVSLHSQAPLAAAEFKQPTRFPKNFSQQQNNNQQGQPQQQPVPVAQNLVAVSSVGNNAVNQNNNFVSNGGLQPTNEADFNDFDHLANFDNFINQPNLHQASSGAGNFTGPFNNMPQQPSSASSTPNNYIPGMMDQLDMQIFGRFLPPYMLQRKSGQDGPGINGGDLPSGLQSTSAPDGDINLESFDTFDWNMNGDDGTQS
ncbi:hypothetical protein WICPIJ_001977 [Wickerhamomyces pijperi]|uniref:Zn(2)-C6 fungal-type domain-containing protein n=1 Tax=Wickerhamomyces pijperi TaxID=599730 RepID=A0A9P8TPD3_WICPI|nr:hypothetical protein WICPIJ_001977 [Wickerhamomyces pijperi]